MEEPHPIISVHVGRQEDTGKGGKEERRDQELPGLQLPCGSIENQEATS